MSDTSPPPVPLGSTSTSGNAVETDPSSSSSHIGPSVSLSPSTPPTTTSSSSRFSFPRASQPEIVRAYQKDVYYRDLFTSRLVDVVRGLVGTRTLHTHMDSIALIGSLAYFGLTSLGGSNQTLGEEYVNAVMVDGRARTVRARRRTAFILLHVLAPFLLSRLYTSLRRLVTRKSTQHQQADQSAKMRARALQRPPPTLGKPAHIYRRVVATLAAKLPSMDSVTAQDGWLAYAGAAHLMLFYLGGKYYGVAQRVAGVSYISTIPQRPGSQPPSYEVLSVLLGIQLGVKLGLSLSSYVSQRRRQTSPSSSSSSSSPSSLPSDTSSTITLGDKVYTHETSPPSVVPRSSSRVRTNIPLHYISASTLPPASLLSLPDGLSEEVERARATSKGRATELENVAMSILKCTLCMDERTPEKGGSAVTECGHIFCWDCVVGWAREKPECPLCRQHLNVSTILPVYNF